MGNSEFIKVRGLKKAIYCILAVMLVVGGLNTRVLSASADSEDSTSTLTSSVVKTINVGTDCITVPTDGWNSTEGSYLRFGWYYYSSDKYRVLSKNTDGTALIDADGVRYQGYFDDENDTNKYADSSVRSELKAGHYGSSGDLFCPAEIQSIVKTSLSASSAYEVGANKFVDDESSDNIAFLLSAQEMNSLYKDNSSRIKTSIYGAQKYMLRSAISSSEKGIAIAETSGAIGKEENVGDSTTSATTLSLGISPAANIDLSKFMFTSSVSQSKKSTGGTLNKIESASTNKIWKLTMADSSKTVTVKNGEKSGNVVTVPYEFTSTPHERTNYDVTQISVVIASGALDDTSTEIYYYGAMDNVNLYTKHGYGKFTLPDGLPETYKVYALAEDVHENYTNSQISTDFASQPVEITFTDKTTQTVSQVNLGAKQIAVPFAGWDKTNGNYLYFGSNNNAAIKNRVLINEGGNLLLDSDGALWKETFASGTSTTNYSKSSVYSHLRNGTDADGNSLFSTSEKACVVSSKLAASTEDYRVGTPDNKLVFKDCDADDNLAFLLSANEAYNLYPTDTDRLKDLSEWLLRSATSSETQVGYVTGDGKYATVSPTTREPIAPATVVDSDKIFLSLDNSFSKTGALTKVGDMTNKEWKTTLKTDSLTVNLGRYEKSGNDVTIPYSCSGEDATQLSIMITSGDITSASTKVLYYGRLADLNLSKEGSATFTLPSGLPTGYKAYAFAEDVNASGLTDYVSEPSDIFADRFNVKFVNDDGTLFATKAVDEGGKVTAPTNDPSKRGYDFSGWFNGDDVNSFDFDTSITQDYTLTAKFSLIEYTITYQNVDGATNTNPTSYTIESETITLKDASKNGYNFDGWYKVVDASSTSLNAELDEDVKVTQIAKGSVGNLTLTAKWSEVKKEDDADDETGDETKDETNSESQTSNSSNSDSPTKPVSMNNKKATDATMSETGDTFPVSQCVLALFVSCCVLMCVSFIRKRAVDSQIARAKHRSR